MTDILQEAFGLPEVYFWGSMDGAFELVENMRRRELFLFLAFNRTTEKWLCGFTPLALGERVVVEETPERAIIEAAKKALQRSKR